MRPGTPDIGDPSSRRRPSSLRTSRLQILPIRTRFCPNLGRFAPQISFPDFGRPETRDFGAERFLVCYMPLAGAGKLFAVAAMVTLVCLVCAAAL